MECICFEGGVGSEGDEGMFTFNWKMLTLNGESILIIVCQDFSPLGNQDVMYWRVSLRQAGPMLLKTSFRDMISIHKNRDLKEIRFFITRLTKTENSLLRLGTA